jgi:carbamate kinase
MKPHLNGKTAVVALGGNAISPKGDEDTIANQFRRTRESLREIIKLIQAGYRIVITHGNGPQVGNALLRVELARGKAPILPLGLCVADTEGGMGYMIEQSLQNGLRATGIDREVVTIVTQIIVDPGDPLFDRYTKFIGQFYSEEEITVLAKESGWTVKEDSGRGWRRVVPSPKPLHIVNARAIKSLVNDGTVVIAAGGGGIPVYIEEDGKLEGVDAVIDKDLASAVLANEIGAEELIILTDVDKVALNFGKSDQVWLDQLSGEQAHDYLHQEHFPYGSMGPKVKAAINFVSWGGKKVIITSIEKVEEAIRGNAGTTIVPP